MCGRDLAGSLEQEYWFDTLEGTLFQKRRCKCEQMCSGSPQKLWPIWVQRERDAWEEKEMVIIDNYWLLLISQMIIEVIR